MIGHWFISLFQKGETPPDPVPASLGAWGGKVEKKEKKEEERQDEFLSPIPEPVAARIKEELLASALTSEIIERAKAQARRRKNQQIAILLTI